MTHHNISIGDGVNSKDLLGDTTPPTRRRYLVTVKGGIFKNGRVWRKGSTVELDEQTATSFLKLGDIKEQT